MLAGCRRRRVWVSGNCRTTRSPGPTRPGRDERRRIVKITPNPIGGYDSALVPALTKAPSSAALARLPQMQKPEGVIGFVFTGVVDATLGRSGDQLV